MAALLKSLIAVLLLLCEGAIAYRPVQFVKHTGDNGRADQGFSLTQYYNTTTSQSDLYVRFESYRYQSSAKGWTALALGPWMTGALMFITYGDPTLPDAPVTVSVRTATGHHPPEVLSALTDFYSGPVPSVDVTYARFEEYTGKYYSDAMQMSPSHIGIAEFVVRGYDKWTAVEISNTSTHQSFIWSSNFNQDFGNDFSVDRHIDMHQFGLGFGFLQVDLQNAAVPEPMFGVLLDQEGHRGVNEIGEPLAPTKQELEAGDKAIADYVASSSSSPNSPAAATITNQLSSTVPAGPDGTTPPTAVAASDSAQPTTSLNPNPIEEPVHNHKQFSLRSFMWHLHGILMIMAFMALYPLGTYLLRSGRPDAFNLHWTIQALGSTSVGLGAIIGYVNSHSISITHQYVGIAIVLSIAAQGALGWRHHIIFLRTKSRSWLSRTHIYLGRVLLPLGFINIITGLQLREYGWFTILLVIVVMIIELVGLATYLFIQARRNVRTDHGIGGIGIGRKDVMTGNDAEEYFQLAGDDDDELTDSDVEGSESAKAKLDRERKKEEAERLRRLDKV